MVKRWQGNGYSLKQGEEWFPVPQPKPAGMA